MILPSVTVIVREGSGVGAGPATTAPSAILNSLPWQGQSMVPLATLLQMQPTCVQTALNALKTPLAGCPDAIGDDAAGAAALSPGAWPSSLASKERQRCCSRPALRLRRLVPLP